MASKRQARAPRKVHDFRTACEEILGQFSEAQSLLECATRALDSHPQHGGHESVCLHHGLQLLRTAYEDLDLAILKLPR